ncbi:mitochondrial proton/calcium exchanger protein-like protein isoform X1 [Tanacetum coccineum]
MEKINNFQQESDENVYQAWERFKELLMKCPQQLFNRDAGEIRASTDAAIRNQGASIKTLEIQIRQMSKVLQERGFGSLPSSTETNSRDNVKSISTIVEANTSSIRSIGSHQYVYRPQFLEAYSYGASHIHKSIPGKEKDPRSFNLPCYINNVCFDNALADLGASDSEYSKGIAENMLVGIGKFIFLLDFVILYMPEDIKVPLILGRPFLSIAHAKIDVFKRKITLRVGDEKIIFQSVKPASSLVKRVYMLSLRERMELDLEARLMRDFGLRRDQVDDLMPTIKECKVIEEFRARNDAIMVNKFFRYPSDNDHDKKIHIDCAYNLKFSCMIDFAVLEDMDAYRDEGMGEVIFGELFFRQVGMNAKRFEGMITIYNGNEKDLAAKKSTKLVKYQSSGILCVIVVMLAFRRMFNTQSCS